MMGSGFSGLWTLFRAELRGPFAPLSLAVVIAIALGGVAVLAPLLIARLVDGVVAHAITLPLIALIAAGFLTCALADAGLVLLRHRLIVRAQVGLRRRMAPLLFASILRLPLSRLRSDGHAGAIRAFDDLDDVIDMVARTMPDLMTSAILTLSYTLLIVVIDIRLAAVALVTLALALLTSTQLARLTRSGFAGWLVERDRRFSLIVESVTSLLTIKSLSAHRPIHERFTSHQQAEGGSLRVLRERLGAADAVNRAWIAVAPGVVGCVGAWLAMQGQISAGELVLFLMVSGSLAGPVGDICVHWEVAQRSLASLDRVSVVLVGPEFEDIDGGADSPVRLNQGLSLADVTYRHGDGAPALKSVTLAIKAGDHVAIAGPSGGGKTTLAHLIARLVDINDGAMHVGPRDASDVPLGHYRRRVLVVPHVVDIFSASIEDNIRLWDDAFPASAVTKAVSLAQLTDVIGGLPDGMATCLTSSGEPLSAGQRQRIGIARAMLREPDILILDEATSSLDAETERAVISNVCRAMAGRTLLVITHRSELASTFPRLLRITDGEVQDEETQRRGMSGTF